MLVSLAAVLVPVYVMPFMAAMTVPNARAVLWGQVRDGTFLWHAVSRDALRAGDHVYVKRVLGLYTHHGVLTVHFRAVGGRRR